MNDLLLLPVVSEVEDLDRFLSSPGAFEDTAFEVSAQRRAQLADKYSLATEILRLRREVMELGDLSLDADEAFSRMAKAELDHLRPQLAQAEAAFEDAFRLKDDRDERNAVIEIRAGAGGDEAAIFAADLFRAYVRFLETRRFDVDVISSSGDGKSFKEVIFSVVGQGAYGLLKQEAGVHRVQRVPATEAHGRIHTSTATVVVLLEAAQIDINIPETDLKVDVFRSSGAGGQNVQKNATAIRVTHIPSGLVVSCQDERSQSQNRLRAMNVLRSRLYEMEMRKRKETESAGRQDQVTSADRSEKIRTYNFPQSRITDHRTGDETHALERFFSGEIGPFICEVSTHLAHVAAAPVAG